jgi:hypothetical protein
VRGPRPDAIYLGLQNHDAGSMVYFREVSVRRSSAAFDLQPARVFNAEAAEKGTSLSVLRKLDRTAPP